MEFEEKYQCHICMEMAHKPIVTPCGHLFCWACIYHWLRSNQEFLTCPLCKSGLELSSVRPILVKNEPPQSEQGGVPPRPRPNRRIRQLKNLNEVPKSLLAMGMNVQRGVMLAGYGIFPSTLLSLFHVFKQPEMVEDRLNIQNKEYAIYQRMKIVTYLIALACLIIVIIA